MGEALFIAYKQRGCLLDYLRSLVFNNLPSFIDGIPVASYPIAVFAICFCLAPYAYIRFALFEWISAIVLCGNHNLPFQVGISNFSVLYDAKQSIRKIIRSIVHYVDIE